MPGDYLKLKGNLTLPCDCRILLGEVLVNEQDMTGESNAVVKNSKNNQLIGGTQIISAKDAVVEVTNTGFRSAKGRLLRTLLYKYGFEKTFMTEVVQFLSVIIVVTLCATIHLMIKFYSDW